MPVIRILPVKYSPWHRNEINDIHDNNDTNETNDMNSVIIGTQWGDEGKGKIIDILSQETDYIVRYQGGGNAGHTVVVGEKGYIFHLIPSGILHAGKICVIGNGVVVDPAGLVDEIKDLAEKGINIDGRLKVSLLCHLIFPYHKILDKLRETKRTHKIGTTGRGIGPCYADKINRCGIRMVDLLNKKVFADKLKDNLKEKNEIFRKVYQHKGFSFAEIYQEYLRYAKILSPFLCDAAGLLNEAAKSNKSILFEGAQGTFLDIDFGTYPFVTSSSAIAGGACIGSGTSPLLINRVIGIAKAYTTRVGEGPFPTEFGAKFGDLVRKLGHEFGATTGRPRRCGWFDAVMVREAIAINGITELAIMKLDVLDTLKVIKICTAYKYKGKLFKSFPRDAEVLENTSCVYEYHPGWQVNISDVKNYKDLPANAKSYLNRLQDLLGAKIGIVSVGSKRSETIFI